MTHRIVIAGAGYAGLAAATRLIHVLGRAADIQLTVIDAERNFVERVRLHQVLAGERLPTYPIASFLPPTVHFVHGRITEIDPEGGTLRVAGVDSGPDEMPYDRLIYALGSGSSTADVPGVAEHALTIANLAAAETARDTVAEIAADNGIVTVVGGGPTGIEAATELAEAYPSLRVRLVSSTPLGAGLSAKAKTHLREVFARLGIEIRAGVTVRELRQDALISDSGNAHAIGESGIGGENGGGERMRTDATVWAGGFSVPSLAADSGLAVNPEGRALVDERLRSLSHPNIQVVGDAAAVTDVPVTRGEALRMACATAAPMGIHAADAIATSMGVVVRPSARRFWYRFVQLNISLGRRDGILQLLRADDSSRRLAITGRTAARLKEAVVRGTIWGARHPGVYGIYGLLSHTDRSHRDSVNREKRRESSQRQDRQGHSQRGLAVSRRP